MISHRLLVPGRAGADQLLERIERVVLNDLGSALDAFRPWEAGVLRIVQRPSAPWMSAIQATAFVAALRPSDPTVHTEGVVEPLDHCLGLEIEGLDAADVALGWALVLGVLSRSPSPIVVWLNRGGTFLRPLQRCCGVEPIACRLGSADGFLLRAEAVLCLTGWRR